MVNKMQVHHLTGWTVLSVFSFNEGVLASLSKRNSTRMFRPDMPHRYAVVIDPVYSSILLAIELLAKNVYVIATIITSRPGFAMMV
ncbi:hypothetical protein PHPALM_30484 [Phytophthora palmivora]|uniref:Uncharacterized protein n=1 Tax=Phytophthora palmivora TaxID=4796 RepID=A0A2P4X520_9STRA|nr:hypothetical protein PHPALM_30484 [Phytophthora palmivora]